MPIEVIFPSLLQKGGTPPVLNDEFPCIEKYLKGKAALLDDVITQALIMCSWPKLNLLNSDLDIIPSFKVGGRNRSYKRKKCTEVLFIIPK